MNPETFIAKYEAALATQDWQQVDPLVHPDACVTFSSGAVHIGKTAVRQAFESNFAAIQDETYAIENVHWVKKEKNTAVSLCCHQETKMNRILLGVLIGIVFGFIDVLLMIPLSFPNQADKRVAMAGAFFDRFAIGVLIGATTLPVAPWLQGIIVGMLVSLPSAIITRTYVPILAIGVVGGALAGFLIGLWGI